MMGVFALTGCTATSGQHSDGGYHESHDNRQNGF